MYKKLFLFPTAFFLLAATALNAQICTPPASQIDIFGNNIKARLLNGGDLFWDFSDALFIPNPTPAGPNPATIFAAGLWIGGVDPAFNLKLATVTYRNQGATDYWSGPLNADGTTDAVNCNNWDRFFRVTGSEINSFLFNLPSLVNNPALAVTNYKSIMGWPAYGNPYFADVNGFDLPFAFSGPLASFHDEDGNGQYNPLKGDYPVVKLQGKPEFVPAEVVWCVFNDHGGGAVHSSSKGKPLQVEVQLTAWAFNCPNEPVLNNTLFTAHRIIHKSTESLDSCFVGMWVDFDLGCYTDDYFGCNPNLSTFYAYNADVVDGSTGTNCTGGIATFGDHPPVQSVTFLSRSLDKFMYYNNPGVGTPLPGTTDPDQPNEIYNYLTGSWRDGSPLTGGGSGYSPGTGAAADFAFPGNPSDPNSWTMCSANLSTFADRRVLGIHEIGHLPAGQIEELVTAWTVHPDPDLPCGLGSTYADIAYLHGSYTNDFAGVCSGLTAVDDPDETPISLYPNPASDLVTVAFGSRPVREIRLSGSDGRLLMRFQDIQQEQIDINIANLPNGIYTIQLLTPRGFAARKFSVLH